ncbi:ABC transporter C family member 10 [Acorus gramineus]|uniref:ABC transporter C family member 10 n=1 Tax=Acorus gramineus TaxID=55184 RepID=A0AAV9AW81_ACOGR|nr:ABC transporter C family member 10 [Acorus gramineus]
MMSGALSGGWISCNWALSAIFNPLSCTNHAFVILLDLLLLLLLAFSLFRKAPPGASHKLDSSQGFPFLYMFSGASNAVLGLIYIGLGLWLLVGGFQEVKWFLLLEEWMVDLLHGFTWFLTSLMLSLRLRWLGKSLAFIFSVFACLFAAFLCVLSILEIVGNREVHMKIVVDIFSLPGALLLLFCALKRYNFKEDDLVEDDYMPLNGETNTSSIDSDIEVTPLATAGFLSRMYFWWLNPLMVKGRKKPLGDKDIPQLRFEDRAESCYSVFMEQLNHGMQADQSSSPSILWTIVACHKRDILVSGFFALLKIVTLSAGPLLLKAFIRVAEGEESFKYEGFVLAFTMFFSKCFESLAQRQWYFRTRTIGLKIRSLLSAAIYQKQQRLSGAAKKMHSSGEIMNYVTVDAYRIGEFPFWFHQTWTTSLQLIIALGILYNAVGLATISAFFVIVLTVLCNTPLAKLQHKFQTKLMEAQDERLKAMSEALINMKVLKLYAWETHFKTVIEALRMVELKWLSAFQLRKSYNGFLFWTSPVLISAATFGTCYLLGIPLYASNVFTFVATLRLVQDPVRSIPDVLGVVIQAKVAFSRIMKFLEAPELQGGQPRQKVTGQHRNAISIKSCNFSWEDNLLKPTLQNIDLEVICGEKVAICGEVGSGKSTILAAILGEVPCLKGTIQVHGEIAYVSQTAWIQTGTVQENILFGSPMDKERYRATIEKCSLVKDLEMLPFGDQTEIGERGVNLSGGQKQRIQLARALYQDADIYLLDDPFSAVDAHTATNLFNDYVMGALSGKTVLLVTHQVDFLPAFNTILLMSEGEIMSAAPYADLMESSGEFRRLVNAHRDTAGSDRLDKVVSSQEHKMTSKGTKSKYSEKIQKVKTSEDQLIKIEERETGDTGLKPYLLYLGQNKGFLYLSLAALCHMTFITGQILQNSWMAANVQNPQVSQLKLITVYLAIGCSTAVFLLFRSIFVVVLSLEASKSFFSQLLNSLFRAPMSFFDSTPLGRILSRVSSDLSIIDLDVPFSFVFTIGATMNAYSNLGVLAVVTWQVLFVSVPMILLSIRLQRYYLSSAKEFMRINGTTKSVVANHLAESLAGATTIRAFKEEERFFAKNLELIDKNASPFFHTFSANEWLIQRLETMSAAVLSSSALAMALLPRGTFSSGFVGMALSYGLSLNMSLVFSIQNQCTLANYIISVERLNQYLHVSSEAPEVIEGHRPRTDWPAVGKVELQDLKIQYRPDMPLVLQGISCTFEGGHKIGIVGRTGSGKSTLIGALFRLVEPAGGRILIDGLDISTIGLHDLRSCLGIIPQDPTLFCGTVRYNLDPLDKHTDREIWEVLEKCQLREAVQEKEQGLSSIVVEDGSNWSMGQRQLFCLGRALLRRCRILVLDEATASIDNTTDAILQKTIRTEFADCTVITVAHRIPTVMDCTMVLAISDGKLVEYDEPMKLINTAGSLFGKLVKEYWSHSMDAGQ